MGQALHAPALQETTVLPLITHILFYVTSWRENAVSTFNGQGSWTAEAEDLADVSEPLAPNHGTSR
jgi:hypothetical protein